MITTISSNFYVSVLDSCSPGGTRCIQLKFFKNAFSGTMIVNKNEGSREMFVLKISCSPTWPFVTKNKSDDQFR